MPEIVNASASESFVPCGLRASRRSDLGSPWHAGPIQWRPSSIARAFLAQALPACGRRRHVSGRGLDGRSCRWPQPGRIQPPAHVRGGIELVGFPDQAVAPCARTHRSCFLPQTACLIDETLFERHGLFKTSALLHLHAPFCWHQWSMLILGACAHRITHLC